MTAAIAQLCDNQTSEAARWWNTERPLTHSSDLSREGLAVNATPGIGNPKFDSRIRTEHRVEGMTECWIWTGAINSDGYGTFYVNKRSNRAHRFAYEALIGPIPPRLVTDHLCRVRRCVNPAHMEIVTNRENVRRGLAGQHLAAANHAKTHCPKGHPYDEANTRIWRGQRKCGICVLARERRRYPKRADYYRDWNARKRSLTGGEKGE